MQREDPGDDQQAWLRSAAEAGAQFVRIVRGRGLGHLASAWVEAYQLGDLSASEEQLDPAAPSLRAVVGRRLPDGNAIASALAASLGPDRSGPLPARPRLPEDHGDELALREACAAFLDWCAASAPDPSPAGAPVFWRSDELRYAFSVTAGGADAPVRFDARALDGDRVDWWTFDLANAPERAAATETVEVVPTRVAFRGSPANRHWEVEDDARRPWERRRGAGRSCASAAAPVRPRLRPRLVAGAAAASGGQRRPHRRRARGRHVRPQRAGPPPRRGRRRAAHVADVRARPARRGSDRRFAAARPAGPRRRAARRAHRGRPADARRARGARVGGRAARARPVGPDGRPRAGLDRPAAGHPFGGGRGELRYVLEGHVPESWLPLLPQLDAATGQALLLRLGRVGSSPANPVGRLLAPAGDALTLREEELPREGVELHRRFRAARSAPAARPICGSDARAGPAAARRQAGWGSTRSSPPRPCEPAARNAYQRRGRGGSLSPCPFTSREVHDDHGHLPQRRWREGRLRARRAATAIRQGRPPGRALLDLGWIRQRGQARGGRGPGTARPRPVGARAPVGVAAAQQRHVRRRALAARSGDGRARARRPHRALARPRHHRPRTRGWALGRPRSGR